MVYGLGLVIMVRPIIYIDLEKRFVVYVLEGGATSRLHLESSVYV
jgi:hypothetical protein